MPATKLWGVAVLTAAALALPVGLAFAHGHAPTVHASGPPVSTPASGSASFSLPAQASGHGKGRGAGMASQVHAKVSQMQMLQREIVAERMKVIATMQQIRAVLTQDVQAGNTSAVTTATAQLKQMMATAHQAFADQQGVNSARSTLNQDQSGGQQAGAVTAMDNIIARRTAELGALTTLEGQLQTLLTNLQAASSSSSSATSSS
jgi:hypothetical protein